MRVLKPGIIKNWKRIKWCPSPTAAELDLTAFTLLAELYCPSEISENMIPSVILLMPIWRIRWLLARSHSAQDMAMASLLAGCSSSHLGISGHSWILLNILGCLSLLIQIYIYLFLSSALRLSTKEGASFFAIQDAALLWLARPRWTRVQVGKWSRMGGMNRGMGRHSWNYFKLWSFFCFLPRSVGIPVLQTMISLKNNS